MSPNLGNRSGGRRRRYIEVVKAGGHRSSLRSTLAWAARLPFARALVRLLDETAGYLPGGFAVLTYHRVAEPGARPWLYPGLLSATPTHFTEQMEMLRRNFRLISMSELLAAYRGSAELPRRAVLVTFDDAYCDFAEHAWPVLRRLGIPVTLFVPTAYPERDDLAFWWDRLWAAVSSMVEGAHLDTSCGMLAIPGVEQRVESVRRLIECHKRMPHGEAMASVEAICERSRAVDGEPSVLAWQDLRRLAAEGLTLAPHSRTHPVLTQVPVGVLQAELESSRNDLLRQVQANGQVLGSVMAYPVGAHNERVRRAASATEYELGFTTERGVNVLGKMDPLRLRRINVGRRSDDALIRAQIVLGTIWCRTGRA